MEKDLVMGVAIGYDFDKIRIFVDSLINTGFNGDLVIVGNHKLSIPESYKKKINIKIIEEPAFKRSKISKGFATVMTSALPKLSKNVLSWALKSISDEKVFLDWFIRTHYVATARYAFYYKFLKENKYRNILLTDIRDVYFQENPFNNFEETLGVFEESNLYQIKNDSYNANWIRKGFGEESLRRIGDNIVCCSGTILGSHKGIMDFLKIFLDTCMEFNVPYRVKGVDQGVFNFLIYTGRLSFAKKHVNGDRILTIARDLEQLKDVKIIDNKFVYHNFQPCIVHQFDRHESLIQFVHKQSFN